jgi:hypothetical protein
MKRRNQESVAAKKGASGAAVAPALEKSAERSPASLPAPAEETSFEGPEKRRSPRYKCEGNVDLLEEGCDVGTQATFTDVSLHGCYVEAQATYPPGTVLYMKMRANGVSTEAKGQVRVTYPYRGMGIAFVDMANENRERLRQLLRSISRPSVIMASSTSSSSSKHHEKIAPEITDPNRAIHALMDAFENRNILTREDFFRILRQSQPADARPPR